MQIKPILARLQSALGRDDLVQQMVLLPSSKAVQKTSKKKTVKLVVGYSGSPNSQTALDMTLWIAHQTRMATQKQVVVHVVYVIASASNEESPFPISCSEMSQSLLSEPIEAKFALRKTEESAQPTAVLSHLRVPVLAGMRWATPGLRPSIDPECTVAGFQPSSSIDHADYVLWQARCLAEEWRGSLEAHLRFGTVAAELRSVAKSEGADLIVLGCHDNTHAIVQQLATNAPCQILGIPRQLHPDEETAACLH